LHLPHNRILLKQNKVQAAALLVQPAGRLLWLVLLLYLLPFSTTAKSTATATAIKPASAGCAS
jgi:hypothetical protein